MIKKGNYSNYNQIRFHICCFSGPPDIPRVACVNSKWKALCEENTLWERLFRSHFPPKDNTYSNELTSPKLWKELFIQCKQIQRQIVRSIETQELGLIKVYILYNILLEYIHIYLIQFIITMIGYYFYLLSHFHTTSLILYISHIKLPLGLSVMDGRKRIWMAVSYL